MSVSETVIIHLSFIIFIIMFFQSMVTIVPGQIGQNAQLHVTLELSKGPVNVITLKQQIMA